MAESPPISFGDRERIRQTPATEAAGVAGLMGNVYGETTPSATGVKVVGVLKEDHALNVHFEERDGEFWFNADDLEFVDHAAGTFFAIPSVGQKWVRTQSGAWQERFEGIERNTLWHRLMRSISRFKRRG